MTRQQNRTPQGSLTARRGGGPIAPAMVLAVSLALAMLPLAPAHAQSGEKKDSVGEDAVDAVTQPLTDLNLRSKDIPEILLTAQKQPYSLEGLTDCARLRGEVAQLDEVLAPDADQPADDEGVVNKGLKAGGKILGGINPFRGLVRQISGAEAERARWEAAVYAGVARRSYLKGYMKGQGCETAEEVSIRSARELLGLQEPEEPESE